MDSAAWDGPELPGWLQGNHTAVSSAGPMSAGEQIAGSKDGRRHVEQ